MDVFKYSVLMPIFVAVFGVYVFATIIGTFENLSKKMSKGGKRKKK